VNPNSRKKACHGALPRDPARSHGLLDLVQRPSHAKFSHGLAAPVFCSGPRLRRGPGFLGQGTLFLARGLQGEGFPLLLLRQRALPSGLPQGVTDSLTSVCGQAMRKFRMVWPQGQLSCPRPRRSRGRGPWPHGRPVPRANARGTGRNPGPGDGSPGGVSTGAQPLGYIIKICQGIEYFQYEIWWEKRLIVLH
jgi:hypothetical protein